MMNFEDVKHMQVISIFINCLILFLQHAYIHRVFIERKYKDDRHYLSRKLNQMQDRILVWVSKCEFTSLDIKIDKLEGVNISHEMKIYYKF
jgi:hypothetical protein